MLARLAARRVERVDQSPEEDRLRERGDGEERVGCREKRGQATFGTELAQDAEIQAKQMHVRARGMVHKRSACMRRGAAARRVPPGRIVAA